MQVPRDCFNLIREPPLPSTATMLRFRRLLYPLFQSHPRTTASLNQSTHRAVLVRQTVSISSENHRFPQPPIPSHWYVAWFGFNLIREPPLPSTSCAIPPHRAVLCF